MKEEDKITKDLNKAFSKTFNANTKIKRRRRSSAFIKKELFISTIESYENHLMNSESLHSDYGIDLTKFQEPLYEIVDKTLKLGFGEKAYELIAFYLYDRIASDGLVNPLVLDMDTPPLFLDTPEHLYSLIINLYPESI